MKGLKEEGNEVFSLRFVGLRKSSHSVGRFAPEVDEKAHEDVCEIAKRLSRAES